MGSIVHKLSAKGEAKSCIPTLSIRVGLPLTSSNIRWTVSCPLCATYGGSHHESERLEMHSPLKILRFARTPKPLPGTVAILKSAERDGITNVAWLRGTFQLDGLQFQADNFTSDATFIRIAF